MGDYEGLTRTTRPRQFGDLIGQIHVSRSLSRMVKRNKVVGSFLFYGKAGCGKTTSARILAASLNCKKRNKHAEPCGKCDSCRGIFSGKENWYVKEIDGGTQGKVDDIREVVSNASFGSGDRFRVYIIDECHLLSHAAWTALLKATEEPNSNVKWMLCTTEFFKVPDAIRTRCMALEFMPVQDDVLTAHIQLILDQLIEDDAIDITSYDEDALVAITEFSEGSVREAISMLESMINFGTITVKSVRTVTGRATHQDMVSFVKSIVGGSLVNSARLIGSLYSARFTDDLLSYLFSEYIPRAGSYDSPDRHSAIKLIRSITNFEPTFRDSVNRDLLLFTLHDAIHGSNVSEEPEPVAESKKKTTVKKKSSKKKGNKQDIAKVNKLIDHIVDDVHVRIEDAWNGKYVTFQVGKGDDDVPVLAVSKTMQVPDDIDFLMPFAAIEYVIDQGKFNPKKLMADEIIIEVGD